MKSITHLRLYSPPVADGEVGEFGQVYQFWKESWTEVYAEIGGQFDPASDGLTRQHEVLTLWSGSTPVAMACHRYVNFRDPSTFEDSYFRTGWPAEAVEKLRVKAQNFSGLSLIGSQIIVARDWRRAERSPCAKELITYASFQRVRELRVPFTIGTIRADRGMDKVFQACGAHKLAGGLRYHGASVDLVYIAPSETPIRVPEHARAEVEKLWIEAKTHDALKRSAA